MVQITYPVTTIQNQKLFRLNLINKLRLQTLCQRVGFRFLKGCIVKFVHLSISHLNGNLKQKVVPRSLCLLFSAHISHRDLDYTF